MKNRWKYVIQCNAAFGDFYAIAVWGELIFGVFWCFNAFDGLAIKNFRSVIARGVVCTPTGSILVAGVIEGSFCRPERPQNSRKRTIWRISEFGSGKGGFPVRPQRGQQHPSAREKNRELRLFIPYSEGCCISPVQMRSGHLPPLRTPSGIRLPSCPTFFSGIDKRGSSAAYLAVVQSR